MNEADIRVEIKHALERRGYRVLHLQDGRVHTTSCPRCRAYVSLLVAPSQKGRPDLIAPHPKRGTIWIEVKDVKDLSFNFSEIEEDQRKYLNGLLEDDYGVFLGIGAIRKTPRGNSIDKIAVIPWSSWLLVENLLRSDGRESIPWSLLEYKRFAGTQYDIVNSSFDATVFLLKDKRGWFFDPTHPVCTGTQETQTAAEKGVYKRDKRA